MDFRKVKLNLSCEPLELEMTVPANSVKVRRMLPVFRAVADAFVEIGEAAAEQKNEKSLVKKVVQPAVIKSFP